MSYEGLAQNLKFKLYHQTILGEDEEPDPELMEIQPEIIMGEAPKPSDPLQVDKSE